jgi:hypothetical protein
MVFDGGECMRRFGLSSEAGRYQIHATATLIGEDLLVAIWGGTKPHIGAVAVALPRPSIADPQVISSTSSVFTLLGHKEDEVVKMVSERLSARLGKNVVVTAGIHWDNLPEEAIGEIVSNCRELADKICALLIRFGSRGGAGG